MTEGIFIGLGANVGNREQNIADALNLLAENGVIIVQTSPIIETPAWGITNQPDFLNAVAQITTDLPPLTLLHLLLATETTFGRVRTEKWSPRTIDLDLLAYHQLVLHHPDLIVPHPFIAERAFVLEPWNAIAPDFILPTTGKRIADLWTVLIN
jgi:dihydroneopterin aldolase/2-amino-4-hydroxy-6-hydroxymethyldihydropteridine diphosphokinase